MGIPATNDEDARLEDSGQDKQAPASRVCLLCLSLPVPTRLGIMISYVDHQLHIGEQADAESPSAFITAVLWTALDIHLSPPLQI